MILVRKQDEDDFSFSGPIGGFLGCISCSTVVLHRMHEMQTIATDVLCASLSVTPNHAGLVFVTGVIIP